MAKRLADRNRGPKKFPHWHASLTYAEKTTMGWRRFNRMSVDEFVAWCYGKDRKDVYAFFYGLGWPEATAYMYNEHWLRHTGHPALKNHRANWCTILLEKPYGEPTAAPVAAAG